LKIFSAPVAWLKKYFWKLTIIVVVIVGAYGFYLDAQIKTRFEGNKWVVPAQLFARPLLLQQGQEISKQEITQELELLGYRKVVKLHQPGEFVVNGSEFRIFRRAFDFAEGFEAQRQLSLKLQSNRLVSIYDSLARSQVNEARLEPMMVTRIITQSRGDRILLPLEEVPQSLIDTLVLVEDRKFYDHNGVSPLAIARALIANIKAGRTVQGGSTLTQQLAKNLFLTRERSLVRKINEAMMAVIIDLRYSKDEIIETYINEVFLGQRGNLAIHGFGLASYYYFNRPLSELNLAEQATLVGMVKGPSAFNPFRRPQSAQKRRDVVLRTLFEQDQINRETYTALVESPINPVDKGILSQHKFPAFMQHVNRELRRVLPGKDLRESGIKIGRRVHSGYPKVATR
jgi:penicillin-binding protein 1B